jgi:hypothetical protein
MKSVMKYSSDPKKKTPAVAFGDGGRYFVGRAGGPA